MKKLFLMLFLGMTLSVSAQQEGERGGQMRERQRQGMMQGRQQKEIEVAPEHKEAFEALKKEYHAERKAVMEKNKGQKLEKGQKPTEEQMNAFMKQSYAKRKALLDLEEKYYGKFRKFLAPWQAAQAVKVEAPGKKAPNFRNGQKGRKGQMGRKGHMGRKNRNAWKCKDGQKCDKKCCK